jgi:hypothetical protein
LGGEDLEKMKGHAEGGLYRVVGLPGTNVTHICTRAYPRLVQMCYPHICTGWRGRLVLGGWVARYKCRPHLYRGVSPPGTNVLSSVSAGATTRYKYEPFVLGGLEEDPTCPCEGTFVSGGGFNWYKCPHLY